MKCLKSFLIMLTIIAVLPLAGCSSDEPEVQSLVADEYVEGGYTDGTLVFSLTDDGKSAQVVGYGNVSPDSAVIIPAKVKIKGKTYDVTSIYVAAFSDALTSIEVPSSIK